ncbi:MAG: Colicin V production protein [Steroidobacteraceae bacterium]|nr:Colicin V production protein [Steroidobacteraceae bacterium]
MTPTDYVLIGIVAVSAIVGLFRGLVREAIALATWILALWFAWHYGPDLEPKLGGLLASPDVRPWAARAIIFFVVLLAGTLLAWLMGYFTRISLVMSVDRMCGFLFGLLRGVVVIAALVILGQTLELDHDAWWKDAKLRGFAESTAGALRTVVGDRPLERAESLLLSPGGGS